MFSLETKLDEVYNTEEFSEFKDYILPKMGPKEDTIRKVKIKFFRDTWLMHPIVDSFNHMLELTRSRKKMFYPLYSEEAVAEKPELKEGALFHFSTNKKSKFVVICAGGGYGLVASMMEAFPVAQKLNEMGYHAFVLNYRTGKYAHEPNPVDDLAKAVTYIFSHADELNVDLNDYAVMGFSAGGHLVSCYGTSHLGYETYGLPKPSALILAYPVITMGEEYNHSQSRRLLLGEENLKNNAKIQEYSTELNVTKDYPPCFVWQCERDKSVPIENSQMLVRELEENEIPYKYNTYDSDAHGWGLATGTSAEGWLNEAVEFWNGVINS